MYRYIDSRDFSAAYAVACLGVTDGDWRALGECPAASTTTTTTTTTTSIDTTTINTTTTRSYDDLISLQVMLADIKFDYARGFVEFDGELGCGKTTKFIEFIAEYSMAEKVKLISADELRDLTREYPTPLVSHPSIGHTSLAVYWESTKNSN